MPVSPMLDALRWSVPRDELKSARQGTPSSILISVSMSKACWAPCHAPDSGARPDVADRGAPDPLMWDEPVVSRFHPLR